MNMSQSVKTCLTHYISFSGRASRSEFWWFFLFVWVALVLVGYAGQAVTKSSSIGLLGSLADDLLVAVLLVLLPALTSASWRRLHDTGRRGRTFLLFGVPLAILVASTQNTIFNIEKNAGGIKASLLAVGLAMQIGFFLLAWLLTRPSQLGPNRYGPNPTEVTP